VAKKKMKIRKSIKRRLKITKTGKVLRRGSHNRHLRRKRNKGQVRSQKVPQQIKGSWKRKTKKLLGQ